LARNQGLTEDQKIILHGQKRKKIKLYIFKLEHKIKKSLGLLEEDGNAIYYYQIPLKLKNI